MISANTFYSLNFRRALLLAAVVLFVMPACGNKTNPLPPPTQTVKKPDKPVLMQKGDSIVVKLKNPFTARSDNWRLKLFRMNKTLLPATETTGKEKSDNKSGGKLNANSAIPSHIKSPDVVVVSDKSKFRKSYPELPKMEMEQFKDSAIKILEFEGRRPGAAGIARDVEYIDQKKYDPKKMHPEAYYYAVDVNDPSSEYGSFGPISGIMTLPIEKAPEISGWKVEEKSLILTIKPPVFNSTSTVTDSYFTGYNLYKGNCDAPLKTVISNKSLEFMPTDWTAHDLLKVIPLSKENGSGWNGIGMVFAGRKEQELRQSILSEATVKPLQNAVLHLKIETRCPDENIGDAKIMFDDGREGKFVEAVIKTEKDWKTFESDFTLTSHAGKLDILFCPADQKHLSYYEIKSISLKVSTMPAVTAEVKPQAEAEKPDKKASKKTASIVAAEPEKKAYKVGSELIKNTDFSSFPELIIKDDKFSMEKEVCYAAVSTLKFDDNYYESENGNQIKVFPKDTFAPDAVKGIYSLAKLDSITIYWQANKEPDLAGYNIYRKNEKDGKYIKLNEEPVTGTEYTDTPPLKNIKYTYYVVAVDNSLEANESKPGETVEFVPRTDVE